MAAEQIKEGLAAVRLEISDYTAPGSLRLFVIPERSLDAAIDAAVSEALKKAAKIAVNHDHQQIAVEILRLRDSEGGQ